MANERLGGDVGGAVGGILSSLLRGKLESVQNAKRNRQAAEVIADIRRSEGLDDPAQQGQIISPDAPRTPEDVDFDAFLRELGVPNPEPLAAPTSGPSRVSDFADTITKEEGLSRIALIFGGVDTPGFKEYAAQIGEIQKESRFNKIAPILGETFGVSEDVIKDIGPEGVSTLMQIASVMPKGSPTITTIKLKQPDGSFLEQKVVVRKSDGSLIALLGDAAPERVTGTVTSFTDDRGNTITIAPVGSQPRAEDQAVGRALGKRKAALSKSRVTVGNFTELLGGISQEISEGKDILGALGRGVGLARSAAFQATRGLGVIGGFGSMSEFLEKFDSAKLSATGRKSARMRVMELSLAALRARINDPSGEGGLSQREITAALKANSPIFGGAPDQALDALKVLMRFTISGFNREAVSLDKDEFNMQGLSPKVRALLQEGAIQEVTPGKVDEDLLSGRSMTFEEFERLEAARRPSGVSGLLNEVSR